MKHVPSLLGGQDSLLVILEVAAGKWGMEECCWSVQPACVSKGHLYPLPVTWPRGQLFWGVLGDAGAAQGTLRLSWLRVQALKWNRPLFKAQLHTYSVSDSGKIISLSAWVSPPVNGCISKGYWRLNVTVHVKCLAHCLADTNSYRVMSQKMVK